MNAGWRASASVCKPLHSSDGRGCWQNIGADNGRSDVEDSGVSDIGKRTRIGTGMVPGRRYRWERRLLVSKSLLNALKTQRMWWTRNRPMNETRSAWARRSDVVGSMLGGGNGASTIAKWTTGGGSCRQTLAWCRTVWIANDTSVKCVNFGVIKWSLMRTAAREAKGSAQSTCAGCTTALNN